MSKSKVLIVVLLFIAVIFVIVGYVYDIDIAKYLGIFSGAAGVIATIYNSSKGYLEFVQQKKTPSGITPYDIMKDRGTIELGFKEDLYYEREIDKDLRALTKNKNGQPSVITICGSIGSGKSRAVYNFIKSPECKATFNGVYIVESSNIKTIAENLKSNNDKTDLIIIDEANLSYDENNFELLRILRVVHNSRSKIAILTYASESIIGSYIEDLKNWIDNNVPEKNPESRPIKHLEIPDIEYEDDVYDWCMTNMYPTRPFSPVIGAYVKELQERVKNKTKQLIGMQDAIDVLSAYKTITTYRKNRSKKLKYTFLMYAAQQGDDKTLSDFNNGLKQVVSLGYISIKNNVDKTNIRIEKKNGGKVDQNKTLEWYRENIIKGDVVCKEQLVEIKDKQLFEEFSRRIDMDGFGRTNDTIKKYLLHSKDSEINRIKALIRIDPNDPVYYSHAITKARNVKPVITEVLDLLEDNGMLSNLKMLIKDDEKAKDISQLIGVIIGRKNWSSIDLVREELEEFIARGLTPDIVLISELLRIVIYKPLMKDDIYLYVKELMERYSLVPNIFYYQRIEEIEKDFDMSMLIKASALLKNLGDSHLDKLSYSRFSAVLLQKATTKVKMDILFDEILYEIKTRESYIIKFSRSNISGLMRKLNSSNDFSKGDLLLHFVKKIKENIDCIEDYPMPLLCLDAVKLSDTFKGAKNIYNETAELLQGEANEKFQRVIALNLFKKIERENEFYESVELLNSFMDAKAEERSNLKLLNTLLGKAPSFDKAIEIFRSDKYTMKRDIYTVNSLFKVILRNKRLHLEYNTLNQITEFAIKTDTIRKDYNILPDSTYLSNFYYICQCYLSRKEITIVPESINKIIAELKEEKTVVKNVVLESQELRAIPLDEVLKKAKAILKEMKSEITKDSDIITSLLAVTISYKNADLYKVVSDITDMPDRIINKTIHYYCRLVVMNLVFKKYDKDGIIEFSLLKHDILNALMDLNNNFNPLFEKSIDIFSAVINRLGFDAAKEILLYAKTLSEEYKFIGDFSKIFRTKQIIDLCRKIDGYDANSIQQMADIQDFITMSPNLKFSEDERKIISAKNKYIRNGTPPIIYIPLLNTNREIRHRTWDNMLLNGSINNMDSNDIQTFIRMEVADIMHNSRNPEIINEIYLIQALECYSKRSNELDTFINNDGYLKLRHRNPEATYDSFFDAFIYLKCIKSENIYRWCELGAIFGHNF